MTWAMQKRDSFFEGKAEGRAEGKAEGESIFAALMGKLFDAGRTDDAKKATTDKEYRDSLYREFGIKM